MRRQKKCKKGEEKRSGRRANDKRRNAMVELVKGEGEGRGNPRKGEKMTRGKMTKEEKGRKMTSPKITNLTPVGLVRWGDEMDKGGHRRHGKEKNKWEGQRGGTRREEEQRGRRGNWWGGKKWY